MGSRRMPGWTGWWWAVVVLLGGAALLLAPAAAHAATFSCSAATSSQTAFRNDGLAELAPDVVITCTGGTPTPVNGTLPQVNLTVFVGTQITSRLLAPPASTSEAELVIDDPGPDSQLLCTTVTLGCVVHGKGGPASYDGSPNHQNVFAGVLSGNSVTFFGVPIDQPGTGTLTLRIVNLRVNAVIPAGAAVTASPSGSPAGMFPTVNSVTLGSSAPRLGFSLLSADGSTAISAGPVLPACGATTRVATIRAAELVKGAFRTRSVAGVTAFDQDVPGVAYGSESGFMNSSFASPFNVAGSADAGTRIQLTFAGPTGATIGLPTSVGFDGSAGGLRLTQSPTGPFLATPGTMAALTLTGNQATATYEVTASDPSQIESANIPLSITAPAGTAAGAVTVSAVPGPQSTVATASATAPVPRFTDKPTPRTIATIVACPPAGGGTPTSGGGPPAKVASIRGLSMTHHRFAVASGTTAVTARVARGTAFRYTLSGAATVRIAIGRVAVARHKRTTHTIVVLTRHDATGANETRFTGRTRTKTLRPGSYVASVTASNGAATSAAHKTSFTVVSRG